SMIPALGVTGKCRWPDCHFLRFRRFSKQIFACLTPAAGSAGKERRLHAMRAHINCLMVGVTTSDDYQPVTWVGRHPVDVTTLLVGVHVLLMVLTCFLVAFGGGAILNLAIFDSAQVLVY